MLRLCFNCFSAFSLVLWVDDVRRRIRENQVLGLSDTLDESVCLLLLAWSSQGAVSGTYIVVVWCKEPHFMLQPVSFYLYLKQTPTFSAKQLYS